MIKLKGLIHFNAQKVKKNLNNRTVVPEVDELKEELESGNEMDGVRFSIHR